MRGLKFCFCSIAIAIAMGLASCGGGGGGGGSPTSGGASTYSLSGQAQKGPFAIGSQITVNELNVSLNPTGKVYNVQTTDNLGNFSVTSQIGTNLVEIVGNGFYMDELTGQLASTSISLRAIADLSTNQSPTINILTTLQEQRLKNLLSQGQTYAQANAQSQAEVLTVFGIDSTKINSLSNFYSMKINGATDADAVLLATSAVLSQMATNAATSNNTSQPAELSNYINTIAAELASTGSYTASAFVAARNLAETQINVSTVKSNLISYYSSHGVTITAAALSEWIDQSNSGVLPQRLIQISGVTFNNVTAAQPNQTNTSNTVTIWGLSTGAVIPVAISSNGTIIKNGNPLTSKYTTLQNGDSIVLQTVSGASSSVTTVTGNIGAVTINWVVTSRSPQVNLQYGLLPSGPTIANYGANTTDSSLYFAYPIVPASSFVANYIGIGGVQGGSSISIYSDASSQPGASLASASFGTYLAGSTLTSSNGTSYTLPANGLGEASFGANGPSLAANTSYWVVIHQSSAAQIGTIWQGVNGYLTGACTPGQNCPLPPPPSTPAPRVAMKSSDGITWTAITGYQTIMPLIYLTN